MKASREERLVAIKQLEKLTGELDTKRRERMIRAEDLYDMAAEMGLDVDDMEEVPLFRDALQGGAWNKKIADDGRWFGPDAEEESRRRQESFEFPYMLRYRLPGSQWETREFRSERAARQFLADYCKGKAEVAWLVDQHGRDIDVPGKVESRRRTEAEVKPGDIVRVKGRVRHAGRAGFVVDTTSGGRGFAIVNFQDQDNRGGDRASFHVSDLEVVGENGLSQEEGERLLGWSHEEPEEQRQRPPVEGASL